MNIKLYEIDPALDEDRLKGYGLAVAQKARGGPDPRLYRKTLDVDLPDRDPEELRGRKLSVANTGGEVGVSNVLVLDGQALFVDTAGFPTISFNTHEIPRQREITGVLLEPGRSAYPARIEQRALPTIFGTRAHSYTLEPDAMLLNQSGPGKQFNREVGGIVLSGSAFLCGRREDGLLCSLSEDLAGRYLEQYAEAEVYCYGQGGVVKMDYHKDEFFAAVSRAAAEAGFTVQGEDDGVLTILSGGKRALQVDQSGGVLYSPHDGMFDLLEQINAAREKIPVEEILAQRYEITGSQPLNEGPGMRL